MKPRAILTDRNAKEIFDYADTTFPFGVWTDQFSLMRNHTLDYHWHNDFEFAFLLEGELDYYLSGTHLVLKQGDCIFVNSNVLHKATLRETSKDATMIVIAFQPSLFSHSEFPSLSSKYFHSITESKLQACPIDTTSVHGKEILTGLQRIYEAYQKYEAFELPCLSELYMIWFHLLEYMKQHRNAFVEKTVSFKHEEEMKKMLSYIQNNYADTILIEDMAHHAGISRSECFKWFKRFTNKSPVDYINEYRLSCASVAIQKSTQPITEICANCGFSSPSYFGKLFKEHYGVTPLQYRKQFHVLVGTHEE